MKERRRERGGKERNEDRKGKERSKETGRGEVREGRGGLGGERSNHPGPICKFHVISIRGKLSSSIPV